MYRTIRVLCAYYILYITQCYISTNIYIYSFYVHSTLYMYVGILLCRCVKWVCFVFLARRPHVVHVQSKNFKNTYKWPLVYDNKTFICIIIIRVVNKIKRYTWSQINQDPYSQLLLWNLSVILRSLCNFASFIHVCVYTSHVLM